MKVCFHFEDFDRDVSSGTVHAMHQWAELLLAFGVKDVAVVNCTGEPIPVVSSDLVVTAYPDLASFEAAESGTKAYVEMDGADYRSFDFSVVEWVVFGGTGPVGRADVGIPTNTHALYAREAAAIILAAI